MAKKLIVQRRVKPYQATGKTTFKVQGKPGVYLIYKNDKLRYIGYSGTNLYKTMYRHFQKWNDKTQARVVYNELAGITVRVVYTSTGAMAKKLEKQLILKHTPPDNIVQYELSEYNKETPILKEYVNENTTPIITDVADIPF